MATVALVSSDVICNAPFLVRRVRLTGGATGAAITHGELYPPDAVFANIITQSPTVTTVVCTRDTSATTMTVDCLGDAADNIELYCVWFGQPGSAGLNAP